MKLALLEALNAARAARQACVVVTNFGTGAQELVLASAVADYPDIALREALQAVLRAGKARTLEHEGQNYFLKPSVPPLKLILIGAVHISQSFIPMGKQLGLDMVVIDPRQSFASAERFPDVPLIADYPAEVLPTMTLDKYCGMVLLTHDPNIDDPVLEFALKAECFYIGALGSRRTHTSRLQRMAAKGFTPEALARIHAPIGLDLGAVSPAEIAVSILAEIIAVLRRGVLHPKIVMDAAL